MSHIRVAGAVVDRRDAQRGEPRDIGPAVLCAHPSAGRGDQCHGSRMIQPRQRTRSHIGLLNLDVKVGEHLAQMLQRRRRGTVGSEPKVNGHRGVIGDDVAGYSRADPDGGQPLPVGAAIDVDRPALVPGQPVQHRREFVNCVVPQPWTRRMCPDSGCRDQRAQGALTARLDVAVGRFAQDRDIGAKPFRKFTLNTAQAVSRRLDLLTVVEDDRDVVRRLANGGRQMQEHCVTGLHVAGAATIDIVAHAAGRDVVGDRDGVEVAGQQHPGRAAEIRAGQDRIAVADDGVVGLLPQCPFDLIGQGPLVPGHAGDVDQSGGQIGRIGAKVKHN